MRAERTLNIDKFMENIRVRYLGVSGGTGVANSRRILGLDGRDSIVSSASSASVSIEERC